MPVIYCLKDQSFWTKLNKNVFDTLWCLMKQSKFNGVSHKLKIECQTKIISFITYVESENLAF